MALIGYAELLCEEADRLAIDELAADLERILTAARDLLELVNGLLDEAAASEQPTGADLDRSRSRDGIAETNGHSTLPHQADDHTRPGRGRRGG
jgi:signal transduction histidine kinase